VLETNQFRRCSNPSVGYIRIATGGTFGKIKIKI